MSQATSSRSRRHPRSPPAVATVCSAAVVALRLSLTVVLAYQITIRVITTKTTLTTVPRTPMPPTIAAKRNRSAHCQASSAAEGGTACHRARNTEARNPIPEPGPAWTASKKYE